MNDEKYRDISYDTRDHCLICEQKVSAPVIELPDFPLSEIYVDHRADAGLGLADQAFQLCDNCGHGQLANVVDLDLQYGGTSNYFFRTSQSASARDTSAYFVEFFESVVGDRELRTIVEIGCNDLYLLKSIKGRARRLVGIDPILKGREDELGEDNVEGVGDFFENVQLDPDVDVLICKDALEHVGDPRAFMKKVVDGTGNDTVYLFQFPLLDTLVADSRFDQVFHQHLNYFSMQSILYMLDDLGCGLLDYRINYDHWAGVLIAFQKGADSARFRSSVWNIDAATVRDRYGWFMTDMEQTRVRLGAFDKEVRYGYGAALMLPVLSYFLKDDLSSLKCIIDDDPSKDGLYYINLPVPISHSSKVDDVGTSVVLLTSTSSKINTTRILQRLFELNPRYIIYPLRTI